MKTRTVALRIAAAGGTLVLVALLGWLAWTWYDSRLPSAYNAMDFGTLDFGGGSVPASVRHGGGGEQAGGHMISVADLKGPGGKPDVRFRLTAKHAKVRLASGRVIDALTFDGRLPGPELRVHEGDLVEVTLLNKDIEQGVSIHWHGVDVPNAEDGVAGVTQDAVAPGGRYTYRFRAEQVGTFWYHTHQVSSKEVRRGLFGAFVIEPRATRPPDLVELTVAAHTFEAVPTLNGNDGLQRRAVEAGAPVRLRLVNTNSTPERFTLGGTAFRVVAIDGTELNGPTPLEGTTLELAGGGRYDVEFTMPAKPVVLALADTAARLAFSPDGSADPQAAPVGREFDPLTYGTPASTPFGIASHFDRRFTFEIGRKPGFYDGHPGLQWTINGGIFPDVPVFVVERGDLVEMTIVNKTPKVHPMHLHGHHVLVLSRNGVRASGSPWWADTLDVEKDERYVVAFRADNPGLWMNHCHNLRHAADGLTMHVVYAGVATPFLVGGGKHNHPE